MLQAWLSIGYIVLLAILVLAFILWRRGAPVLAIAALVVGIPLWFGWEYARPTWTTGVITGTEVRRSDPDAHGNTTDIEYIYMRNRSDRGLELTNDRAVNDWVGRVMSVLTLTPYDFWRRTHAIHHAGS